MSVRVDTAQLDEATFGGPVYRLSAGGVEAVVSRVGASLVDFIVPDGSGAKRNIVLGYGNENEYLNGNSCFIGTTVGPYCNRIRNGAYTLPDGRVVDSLERNCVGHCLHSGSVAWHHQAWNVVASSSTTVELEMPGDRPNGGFPASIVGRVKYELVPKDGKVDLVITTSAKPDAWTPISITNHAYFNLDGRGSTCIEAQVMQLESNFVLDVDQSVATTGGIRPIAGTAFDFTTPHVIGERMKPDDLAKDEQLRFGDGYDHCWVLRKRFHGELSLAAKARSDESKITLEVLTTLPGLQFYAGSHLPATIGRRRGFCLESQQFPGSPGVPHFPTPFVAPGEEKRETIIYRVGVA